MREPKARVGVRAGDAEAFVWERVSGESGRPFEPCQMPGLTGVRSHHSLFGLLGFRGPSDPADVGAISKLASEPSSSPFHPSSLDSEPFSLPVGPDWHSAQPITAPVKHATLEPAALSSVETSAALSSASQPAYGATVAAIHLDPVATTESDFAPPSTVDPSATLNSGLSALASATTLVSDGFISAIPAPGSSNQAVAADFHSDISAIAAQDSIVQTTVQDSRFDISAISAHDSSVQTTAEDPRSDINDWSAGWRAAVGDQWGVYCCGMCGSAQSPGGLDGGQPVLNNTVDLGLLSDTGSSAPGIQSANASTNPIVLENMLQGSPQSEWGIDGGGSANIEGFATDISVDNGHTVSFKINTDFDALPH